MRPRRAKRALVAAAAAVAAGALSCAGPPPRAQTSFPAPAPSGARPSAWRYEVAIGPGARELAIEVSVPRGPPRRLSVDDGAEPFVRDVALVDGSELRPIAPRQLLWTIPSCPEAGCRVRYRFLLADAAEALDDPGNVVRYGDAFESPPSLWLIHPVDDEDTGAAVASTFRLRVTAPAGIEFVSGLLPSSSDPSVFEAPLSDLNMGPYSAFGPLRIRRIEAGGASLQIAIFPGALELDDDAWVRWIDTAARSVAGYYGRFPVAHALVLLAPSGNRVLRGASALGNGGASILAHPGRATTADDLAKDWQMTHEMIHLAFPNIGRRHAWLEEGLSTYVEPIARARAGVIPVEDVWKDLVLGLPKGLPMAGDKGLDNTPTWGRIYWGGALFCLLADLGIRERTGNRRSLDDALRGILAAGGDITVGWPIERALTAGDRATGVPVLTELYERMKDAPVDVDLDALWRRLGIGFREGRVRFDDGAPLASLRRSIAERSAAARP